ncbi:MopE-related protein [Myxococcaceae bacterium GXIMD 01537]
MSLQTQGARALPLLLATTLLGLAACKAPTYEELEKERRRQCDATHACADGYTCLEGLCFPGAFECKPEAQRACGVTRGECRQGTETCGQDGKWGTCVGEVKAVAEACNGKDDDCDDSSDEEIIGPDCGLTQGVCAGTKLACMSGALEQTCGTATYGLDYEQQESRCDNKDNDCDGLTDEELSAPCDKQTGVCLGARVACQAGSFGTCSDAVYRAHAPAFQPLELACDAQDNDCDGATDKWASAINLSNSDKPTSRHPALAVVPNTKDTAVMLYEENGKLVSRLIGPQGLGAPRVPSVSVDKTEASFEPVLATDGESIAAAWLEREGDVQRVMITTLDSNGVSNLLEGTAIQAFTSLSALAPTALTIAVHKQRIAIATVDQRVRGKPTIRLETYKVAKGTLSLEYKDIAVGSVFVPVGRPHLSARPDGIFLMAHEVSGNGIALSALYTDGKFDTGPGKMGGETAREPFLFPNSDKDEAYLYYVVQNGGRYSLASDSCTYMGACTTVLSPLSGISSPAMTGLQMLAPEFGTQPIAAVWEDQSTGATTRFVHLSASGKPVSGILGGEGAKTYRPSGVVLTFGEKRTLLSVYDTAEGGGGGLNADEVYAQPACIP